jgi:hypothetical protein
MDIDEQVGLENLLFFDRRCRVCGEVKNLLSDFYLIRKNRKNLASSYSYECKTCTIKRISKNRKKEKNNSEWCYPDW